MIAGSGWSPAWSCWRRRPRSPCRRSRSRRGRTPRRCRSSPGAAAPAHRRRGAGPAAAPVHGAQRALEPARRRLPVRRPPRARGRSAVARRSARRSSRASARRRRGLRPQQQLRARQLGPDGTAYVGVLGGLDRAARSRGAALVGGLGLHVRRLGRAARAGAGAGRGTRLVRRVDFSAGASGVARDRRRPFKRVVRVGRGRVKMRARIVLKDGRRVTRTRRVARVRNR